LNPANAFAHNALGVGLEKKSDLRGALQEYRMATQLAPQDATLKQNYERVLQQVNK
jgi:Flp pilus assembly protein TadD